MSEVKLILGDCLDVLPTIPGGSVDSIVTDPPYGLKFMGKHWDHGIPGEAFWREMLRVAKPGAHLLAFGGTRTHHRLMVAIEDAGWEIRDCLMWIYGSGFPKSMDVSKAIDKAAGAEREVIGHQPVAYPDSDCWGVPNSNNNGEKTTENSLYKLGLKSGPVNGMKPITAPATDAARQWEGWGTALKPAYEPIILARKPLDGTVAQNVLAHGTGGINIDACRVETDEDRSRPPRTPNTIYGNGNGTNHTHSESHAQGRWPANVIFDEEAAAVLDAQSGTSQSKASFRGLSGRHDAGDQSNQRIKPYTNTVRGHNDTGGASRFFYCAKASKRDRDEGLEGMEERFAPTMGNGIGVREHDPKTATPKRNFHPTVKPTDLMCYLVRLITPSDGVILDPFCGSGSTGKAAMLEGFSFVGIELEPEYLEIAKRRIDAARMQLRKQVLEQLQLPLLEATCSDSSSCCW